MLAASAHSARTEKSSNENIATTIESNLNLRGVNLPDIPPKSILKNSSDSTVDTSDTFSSSRCSQVSFEGVQIRHYEMELGDHPSCTIGAPVTLSLEFEQDPVQDIDEYEFERGRRRTLREPAGSSGAGIA